MLNCGLKFHHLGLAVKNPDEVFTYLTALGYTKGVGVFDPLQQAHVMMWNHDVMPAVEVIWPGDGPSPIDKIIKKGSGHIYHQCYTTFNAEASLAALREAGLDVLPFVGAKPAVLFGGVDVSFYAIDNVGIIELIHTAPIET
jgi:hypothetical protein